MQFKITVQKGASVEAVERIERKLANKTALMKRVGKAFEVGLQAHFRRLNNRPNKRGWRKTNFWAGIAKATTFISSDENSATVAITNGKVFGAKVHGATIRPTGNRRFLAIPAIESRYGVSPSSLDKNELQFRKTRKGGLLGEIRSDGTMKVHYWLVRQARTPADANALPKSSEILPPIKQTISTYLKTK